MKYLIVMVLGLMGGMVWGQATTGPAGDGARIQALVKKLSDDSYQVRQDAQDQLVRFGEEAKPYLQELLKQTKDAEARERAESAVAQIDENRTMGPSLVTIHVKDAAPGDVLKMLSKQGMYEIPTMPDNLLQQEHINWPKVTMDVDRKPFLEAMREFCQKTGLRPNAMGNERKFVLMQGGDDFLLGPAVFTGPFMVVANSATKSSSVNFAQGKTASKNLNIQFTFFAEPKLNIMGHDYYLRLIEAVDDHGNSLVVPTPTGFNSMGQDGSARWTLNGSLAIPDNLGTTLARVKGVTRVLMQTKSEVWEVPDIMNAKSPSKSIDGRRYTVEDFHAAGDNYQFKFTMKREAPRVADWQQYGRGVRVTLLDEKGKALSPRGYGGGGSDEKLVYTYTFGRDLDGGTKAGTPTKLVVEVPTDVKEVEVPFEFKDLALP